MVASSVKVTCRQVTIVIWGGDIGTVSWSKHVIG